MALEGVKVRLREQRISDMPIFVSLKNDLDTQAWNQRLSPDLTLEMAEKFYRDRPYSTNKTSARFMIEEKSTGEIVGFVAYSDVKVRFSTSIGVALRKEYFGKGYAFEACDILMKFLFHEMGLKTLSWYTTSYNQASVKLGLKLGFKEAIRLRKSTFINGDFYDGISLDILREEFYERHTELVDNIHSIEI